MAVERLILRRMIGESALSVIMVTVGLASALSGVALGVWGAQGRPRPGVHPLEVRETDRRRLGGRQPPLGGGRRRSGPDPVGLFFQKSRHGVAMRAVADDQQAAMVQGINVNRIFAMAWALSGAAAAIGGVLLAGITGSYGIELQGFALLVFPVVILGGLDSVLGTVVGGIIVGLLVEYSKSYISVSASVLIPFAALVAILLVKPYGLFGQVRIERV